MFLLPSKTVHFLANMVRSTRALDSLVVSLGTESPKLASYKLNHFFVNTQFILCMDIGIKEAISIKHLQTWKCFTTNVPIRLLGKMHHYSKHIQFH